MGTRAGLEYPEGDAGGLVAAARRLAELASYVGGEAGTIDRASRISGWEGNRYTQFRTAVEGVAPSLDGGADGLRRAARMVEDLADRVQRAQRRIRAWAEEIEGAEQEVRAARSALMTEHFMRPPLGDPIVPFPAPDRLHEAQDRHAQAANHLSELRGRYEPQARLICGDLAQDDRRAAAALLAAAAAAPVKGLDVPGAPRVPADVRLFAPVWLFAPGESFLPADPRRNDIDRENIESMEDYVRFLAGQGSGAPIFYRVCEYGSEKVIEYWFYRRWNDFRDLGIPGVSAHPDDSEGVAVRIRDGRPVQVGYTQHEHGCSLPYGDAPKHRSHPVSYPGDGSGSNSPYRGHDDRIEGPFDDLHGPAPGERTPRDHVVHGEDHSVDFDGPDSGRPWRVLDPEGDRVPDSEPNEKKFRPGADTWSDECKPLPPRE